MACRLAAIQLGFISSTIFPPVCTPYSCMTYSDTCTVAYLNFLVSSRLGESGENQFLNGLRRHQSARIYVLKITIFGRKDFLSPSFSVLECHLPLPCFLFPCVMVFTDKAAFVFTTYVRNLTKIIYWSKLTSDIWLH